MQLLQMANNLDFRWNFDPFIRPLRYTQITCLNKKRVYTTARFTQIYISTIFPHCFFSLK